MYCIIEIYLLITNESEARVIDENNEYSIVIMGNFERHSPSILQDENYESRDDVNESVTTMATSRSEAGNEMLRLANVASTAGQVFSLVANVLETFGESSNDIIKKSLLMLKGAKYFCEGARIVLGMFATANDKAVVQVQLNKIFQDIRGVRNDIRQLEQSMIWATSRMQYADICTMIVTGVTFCEQIQCNAENESLKHDYEERLKELCSNQRFTLVVSTLLDGITGQGDFRVDILQLIYTQCNGSRPDVMRMAGRFVQLLTGGMITLLTYETLVRGEQSAKQLEEAMYADRFKEAEQCYKQVMQRCVDESKENMARDVDNICAREQEFEDLLRDIWLQFQCMAHKNGVVYRHGSRIEKRVDGHRADIICFYTSRSAFLPEFSLSEKSKMSEIISKRQRSLMSAVSFLLFPFPRDKPDGYDAVIDYLNQISEKRQCWLVGASKIKYSHARRAGERVNCNGNLLVHHEVPEGSYQHMIGKCKFTEKYCFVSLFFQD